MNPSGTYGQNRSESERYNNIHSNTNSDINGMNDSSLGSSRNTDTSFGSSRTKDNTRTTSLPRTAATAAVTPPDTAALPLPPDFSLCYSSGAEKLAGKMMGMQVRGQERKMGEVERKDF
ncbi:hypothetical protein C8R44DRAFT_865751 [Mycena epipterygia]|nr:hypothetical protein C8R44DRAFT_865751 [Mycena epipterygia]